MRTYELRKWRLSAAARHRAQRSDFVQRFQGKKEGAEPEFRAPPADEFAAAVLRWQLIVVTGDAGKGF
jgi:hypothetical protein